jgi:hypothetical protein
MKNLHRFWFNFQNPPQFSPLGFGCGITAHSYEDATSILASTVFAGGTVPIIKSVIEDVDVQMLDPSHVVPNMGSVVTRGVWFPLGY